MEDLVNLFGKRPNKKKALSINKLSNVTKFPVGKTNIFPIGHRLNGVEYLHPAHVQWAQNQDIIFLTFMVQDGTDIEVNLQETFLEFKCTALDILAKDRGLNSFTKAKKQTRNYGNTIHFYKNVDRDKSVYIVRGRSIDIWLLKVYDGIKSTPEEDKNLTSYQKFCRDNHRTFWPKLCKGYKPKWLGIDFTKWKDESDSDDSIDWAFDMGLDEEANKGFGHEGEEEANTDGKPGGPDCKDTAAKKTTGYPFGMSDALDSFSIFNSVLQPSSNQLNRMKQQMTELAGTPSSQPKAKDADDNDNDKLKMGGIIKELAEAHQKQGKTELPEEFRGIGF